MRIRAEKTNMAPNSRERKGDGGEGEERKARTVESGIYRRIERMMCVNLALSLSLSVPLRVLLPARRNDGLTIFTATTVLRARHVACS